MRENIPDRGRIEKSNRKKRGRNACGTGQNVRGINCKRGKTSARTGQNVQNGLFFDLFGAFWAFFDVFLTVPGHFLTVPGDLFPAGADAIPRAATPPRHTRTACGRICTPYPARTGFCAAHVRPSPPVLTRWTFCTRSRKCRLNRPGPGRNPERSRTRSDRLSNPAAADCGRFLGTSVGVSGATIAAPTRAFPFSSSLMRVFLRFSARSRQDDKIPAQKNERNFARLRTRMMYILMMRVLSVSHDLSPFTFQLSISDLSFLAFHLSNMRFHFSVVHH